jgi:SAM-dependent methyltransferase
MAKKDIDTREIGLEVGLILGKYLFHTEDLHYGLWTDGLEVDVSNMAQAQKNHSDLIVSKIPEGVKTILDVGCGVGAFAERLISEGYQVDGVSPSAMFARRARERLGDRAEIFECIYEDLDTEKRYDLVLFSESFQYVKLMPALEKTIELLNHGGHLLICDFFKIPAEGKSALGGGHKLHKFYDRISRYPFEKIEDMDITKETAPNLDLVDDFLKNVGKPVWDLVFDNLDRGYPRINRLVRWRYKRRIDKLEFKYFSGQRNGDEFKRFKSYRLLLYRKKAG